MNPGKYTVYIYRRIYRLPWISVKLLINVKSTLSPSFIKFHQLISIDQITYIILNKLNITEIEAATNASAQGRRLRMLSISLSFLFCNALGCVGSLNIPQAAWKISLAHGPTIVTRHVSDPDGKKHVRNHVLSRWMWRPAGKQSELSHDISMTYRENPVHCSQKKSIHWMPGAISNGYCIPCAPSMMLWLSFEPLVGPDQQTPRTILLPLTKSNPRTQHIYHIHHGLPIHVFNVYIYIYLFMCIYTIYMYTHVYIYIL